MIKMNMAPLNKILTVKSFAEDCVRELTEVESRLMHLGFIHGQTVRITKKAPLFQEPLLVEVRGRLVALSSAEAKLIEVEVHP
ncbi:MAG: ferrous iron transport protein A [Bacteriovoracaceae bacterium]